MIIFGWGNRQSVVSEGNFECPVCCSTTQYNQLRSRRWFTLFFIPVFPISQSQDSIQCRNCQSVMPMQAFSDQSPTFGTPSRLSPVAICGMLLGIISLLMVCIFFVSAPLSLFAVMFGHIGLRDVKKGRPHVDGRWQAITALITGYLALTLSVLITGFVIYSSRNGGRSSDANALVDRNGNEEIYNISESNSEAFKAAEYEIASKRDKPAGRGNSPEAIALATDYAEKLKELSELVFTSESRPLLKTTDVEYLTYCQLNDDRCLFLVHVPSYRKFTGDAKKALAEIAWAIAQSTTAGKLQPNAKLGVGLRGVLLYGDILLGTPIESEQDVITAYQSGEKEDLIAFFESNSTKIVDADLPSSQPDNALVAPMPEAGKSTDQKYDIFQDPVARNTRSIDTSKPEPSVANPAQSARSPEAAKSRTKAADKIEFENKIPIQPVNQIDNPLWGFYALAFSPNGRWIAGGKMDESVYIFDRNTGQVAYQQDNLRELGPVRTIAFSNTGEHFIAGGYRGQVASWDISNDGHLTNQVNLHRFDGELKILTTSSVHSFYMGVTSKGTIGWQAFGDKPSQPRFLQALSKNVKAVWLPKDGTQAMATDGTKLVRFSLRDAVISQSIDTGIKNCQHASFSVSGTRLACTTYDTLHFYDVNAPQQHRMVKLSRGDMARSLIFHPNEKWIAVGMRGKVAIYDFDNGELIAYIDADSVQYQTNITMSDDGKLLATCSESARDSIKVFQFVDSAGSPLP